MGSKPSIPVDAVAVRATAILAQLNSTDREILALFERELPTLRFRAADGRAYVFSHVLMSDLDNAFLFILTADEHRHKEAVPSRRLVPREETPLTDLLYLTLDRIHIVDPETRHRVIPSVVERVEGGYDLVTEEEFEWALPAEVRAEQDRRRDLGLEIPECATVEDLIKALAAEAQRLDLYRLGTECYDFTQDQLAEMSRKCPVVTGLLGGYVCLEETGSDRGRVMLNCAQWPYSEWLFWREEGEVGVDSL
jgi:hypothetical protein